MKIPSDVIPDVSLAQRSFFGSGVFMEIGTASLI